MEETKTAEEIAALSRKKFIDHLIWCIDNAKKLYADQSEMYEKIISRKQSELTQQQSANAELKKQNEELVEALKILKNEASDLYDHCIDRGYLDNEDLTEGQESLLSAFELANKAIKHTT